MNVISRARRLVYTPDDYRIDRRLHPGLRSMGGHGLKPFVDFREYAGELRWFTILREPIERFISHFEHQVERTGYTSDFMEWMRKYRRSNFQVRMIAGEEDLEAAKQILDAKFACEGLQCEFNKSLLLMRHALNLGGFSVNYIKASNVSKGTTRQRIYDSFHKYQEQLIDNNDLDLKLYDYVRKRRWPEQVSDYGKQKLENDQSRTFVQAALPIGYRLCQIQYVTFRNLVYKPACYLQKLRSPRHRERDVAEEATRGS
mgnify:FL=1